MNTYMNSLNIYIIYMCIYIFLCIYFFINLYISIHTMHTSIANKQYKDEHVLLTSAGFSFVHFMSHCETAVRPSCAAACAVPREHQNDKLAHIAHIRRRTYINAFWTSMLMRSARFNKTWPALALCTEHPKTTLSTLLSVQPSALPCPSLSPCASRTSETKCMPCISSWAHVLVTEIFP